MGKLTVGDIPGYAEAVSREQQNREVAYLDVPFDVCGIKLRQMTPRILATLFAHGSSFVCGGAPTMEAAFQFLWACSVDFSPWRWKRKRFFNSLSQRILAGLLIEDLIAEIYDYCDTTFQDAPRGGGVTIPYASQIAWIEFDTSGDPWRWDFDSKTADLPLRRIYQQMRCASMSKGQTPINPSDRVRQEWADARNREANGNS